MAARGGFYRNAIHFIFAIIIAQSFVIASDILIPIDGVAENAHRALNLILSYVVIIAGWVGYARSMSVMPHKDSRLGALRFVLDLVILFEYFYLLQILQTSRAGAEMHLVMIVIFGTYLLWDAAKYFEYTGKADRRMAFDRAGKTAVLFLAHLLAPVFYQTAVARAVSWPESVSGADPYVVVFPVVLIAMTVWYRAWKWNMKGMRARAQRKR